MLLNQPQSSMGYNNCVRAFETIDDWSFLMIMIV